MKKELKEEELKGDVSCEARYSCMGGVDYIYTIRLHTNEYIDQESIKVIQLKEVLIPEKLKECADLMGVDKEEALNVLWENFKNK